jgi:hypothetical protein
MSATDLLCYGILLGWSVLVVGVAREIVAWWPRPVSRIDSKEKKEPTLEPPRRTEIVASPQVVQTKYGEDARVLEILRPVQKHQRSTNEPGAADAHDKPSKHLTSDGRDRFKLSKQEYHTDLDSRMLTCSPSRDYPPSHAEYISFRNSDDWKKAARAFRDLLKEKNEPNRCLFSGCGMTPANIDHIKPLVRFWSKRLEPSNFQLLCERHIREKGNTVETDFRPDHWRRWFDT